MKIRILNDTVMAYVKVISYRSSGGTEEDHEYPVRLVANRTEIRAWYYSNQIYAITAI
jgi:hypothetical protein